MATRRVLHVLDTAEPAGSAIFKIVETLVAGVDRSRYEFEVCFLREGKLARRLSEQGVKANCVDWNGSLKDPAGMARYAGLLRSADFSIIHQHTGGRSAPKVATAGCMAIIDGCSGGLQCPLTPGKPDHDPGKQELQAQSPQDRLQSDGAAIGGE